MTHEQWQDIQVLAFIIWERNGYPEGCALDHWLEAEYLVLTNSFVEEDESASGIQGEAVFAS